MELASSTRQCSREGDEPSTTKGWSIPNQPQVGRGGGTGRRHAKPKPNPACGVTKRATQAANR
eukprot:14988442-Heterocapsa_arctica.AAC.1